MRSKRSTTVLIAIALLATAGATWYGHTYWQIAVDGVTANAMSVKPEAEPKIGKTVIGDPHRYFASYRFIDADGREHASRQSISRDLYEALSQGDIPLMVHYSRARPDVNVNDLDAIRWLSLILAALAAACWGLVLLRAFRTQ